ncbi:MAG: hypothetical protein JWP34_4510 [Massilia sp.]|nr:hypothetical protein [Massilia sp.]
MLAKITVKTPTTQQLPHNIYLKAGRLKGSTKRWQSLPSYTRIIVCGRFQVEAPGARSSLRSDHRFIRYHQPGPCVLLPCESPNFHKETLNTESLYNLHKIAGLTQEVLHKCRTVSTRMWNDSPATTRGRRWRSGSGETLSRVIRREQGAIFPGVTPRGWQVDRVNPTLN